MNAEGIILVKPEESFKQLPPTTDANTATTKQSQLKFMGFYSLRMLILIFLRDCATCFQSYSSQNDQSNTN